MHRQEELAAKINTAFAEPRTRAACLIVEGLMTFIDIFDQQSPATMEILIA